MGERRYFLHDSVAVQWLGEGEQNIKDCLGQRSIAIHASSFQWVTPEVYYGLRYIVKRNIVLVTGKFRDDYGARQK